MSRKQRKTLFRICLASVLMTVEWVLTAIDGVLPDNRILPLLLFIVPYLVIGYDILWSAARNIFRGQVFDEQFLMSLATVGAFAVGEYPEASFVMLFYQLGELFQSIAVGKSRRSVAALMDIRPDSATVVRQGTETEVSPEEVSVGETIVIKPGERIPLDGEILSGITLVDTAALTGESLPVDRQKGDKVISGSVNLSGVIYVRTESLYGQSTVVKILELVENASEKKAKAENFITRFARYYTPCVVIAAVLVAVLPPLLFRGVWRDWISNALIFLVVSCPCALVVSVPLSFFGGIGGASKHGILMKGAAFIERLASVDTVVFDKTGTLTKGTFAVDTIHPSVVSAKQLLDIAAAAESHSNHPVARSIVSENGGHIDASRITKINEYAGKGISAVIDGQCYYVGNGALMEQSHADYHECHLSGTVIHVSRDAEYLGHIVISDEIKPDSAETIASLRSLGVTKTVMLTGDNEKTAEAVASAVGMDEVRPRLLPAQKVEAVEGLLAEGRCVAFVGDGINDAPVLTRADVGIAMGALGSDAAIESADIVLMDDKPSKIALAVRISRKTMRIVRENIVFALAVKGIILFCSALGIGNMWIAVFGDVGVTVLAVLNAIRALRIK